LFDLGGAFCTFFCSLFAIQDLPFNMCSNIIKNLSWRPATVHGAAGKESLPIAASRCIPLRGNARNAVSHPLGLERDETQARTPV
jgi:hypothetical protein